MEYTLRQLKANYGYLNDIDVIYGNDNGYYFTVLPLDRKNMIGINFSVEITENLIKQLESLRMIFDSIPQGAIYKEGRELWVELNLLYFKSANELKEIISAMTKKMESQGVKNVCSQSGSLDDVGLFRVGTKVKVLSASSFYGQVETKKINYRGAHKTNTPLAWISALAILLGMMILWYLVGNIFFIISASLAAGGLRLTVKTFEKFAGRVTRKDTLIIIGLFVMSIFFGSILSPIVSFMGQGAPLLKALGLTFEYIFTDGSILGNYVLQIASSLAISLWGSWNLIQELLNGATSSKRVTRKNTRLM